MKQVQGRGKQTQKNEFFNLFFFTFQESWLCNKSKEIALQFFEVANDEGSSHHRTDKEYN